MYAFGSHWDSVKKKKKKKIKKTPENDALRKSLFVRHSSVLFSLFLLPVHVLKHILQMLVWRGIPHPHSPSWS